MKNKKANSLTTRYQLRKSFCLVVLAIISLLFSTFPFAGIANAQTTLFTVTYVGGDPTHRATILRGSINYPVTTGMKIFDGDYLRTKTQKVQLTDEGGSWFRFGSSAQVELREVSFTEEGYGIYLDLGEIYAKRHKCVKIRSCCWACSPPLQDGGSYFSSFDGNVGQFDAVSGDLVEGEYDEFGVFHKDYDIPEGYYLRMTGWPPTQVSELGEIPQSRLDYIAVNYGNDSQWMMVGGIWIPVDKLALLIPYIGLSSTIIIAAVATATYIKRVKHRKE